MIHHDLKELDEWSKKWLMSFNPDKTEIMLFSNTDISDFNFTFNGRTILITNFHKHMGVTAMLNGIYILKKKVFTNT